MRQLNNLLVECFVSKHYARCHTFEEEKNPSSAITMISASTVQTPTLTLIPLKEVHEGRRTIHAKGHPCRDKKSKERAIQKYGK
mmetsp:Transcript_103/g.138  ORF Transcript_103/g.138 Transcript_103/m.138 type:complete len:84 (-) Transcript_103:297-548(-)